MPELKGLKKNAEGQKKGRGVGGNFLERLFVNGIFVARDQGVIKHGCFFC